MKLLPFLCLWLTSLSLSAGTVRRPVLMQLERITLQRVQAYDLLLADLSGPALRAELLKLVATGSARLDQFLLLRTLNGVQVTLQQMDELPYAADFDPPKMPGELVLADKAGAEALKVVRAHVPPPIPIPTPPNAPPPQPIPPPPPREPTHKVGIGLRTTAAPKNLAFKRLGDFVNITPTLDQESGAVRLRFTSQSLRYLGEYTFHGTSQPCVQSQQLNLSSAGPVGQPIFLGTCSKALRSGVSGSQEADEISLQFITVTTSIAGLPPLEVGTQGGTQDPFFDPSTAPLVLSDVLTAEQIQSKKLRFQFDLISLPTAAAHALVETQVSDASMLKQLQEMIHAGTATLEDSLAFHAKSQVKDHAEHVTPYEYAEDFSRFYMPTSLEITDPKIMDLLHLHGGGDAEEAAQFDVEMISVAEPKDFKTRRLGLHIDYNAELMTDGATMQLSIAPDLVRHLGERKITRDLKPIFATQGLRTTVLLGDQSPLLLGTMSRARHTGAPGGNQEDRISFAFITGFVE